jgi:phosphatidylinositol alpha-mannosyltransferase
VIPVGRSVIVPANRALPNIVLSPRAIPKIKRALERERFDVLHLHEPMTPVICTATLAWARVPVVATFHASGDLGWLRAGKPMWGFMMERIDRRIAVSPAARESAAQWFPGDYDVIPNGVLIPDRADPGGRENRVVFVGRHDPRKGMPVLLRAWPEIHRQTGARLRLVGADPLMVRLAIQRAGTDATGIDALGFVPQEELTEELASAKALVAPSLGGESFGMVLTRPFACATPVVASDIDGYRQVMTDETGVLVPPGEPEALAKAVVDLLGDEPRRQAMGEAARRVAAERYSWDEIGRRLAAVYEELA